jgi:2-haloacid dehalogenase
LNVADPTPEERTMGRPPTVSFDVYSALIDSRRGAGATLARTARERGWRHDGEELYVGWDARNKALHAQAEGDESFRSLAARAMADLLASLDLPDDAVAVTDALLADVGSWPTWPDVPEGLAAVAARHPIALLSNIDDDVLAATRVGHDVDERITSQRAGSFKPARAIYDHARSALGDDLVHVPASARDVHGSLAAGLRVVRVVRPGYQVDPAGPQPEHEVDDLRDLPSALRAAGWD